ncbi:MAG: TatD family hydrolase [Verrucomicrobiota bacterium]|jgi:TatD DNase family protein
MPVPRFTDTHAHLDFPDFAPDVESVVARAVEAGVHRMISIGCDLASSQRAIAIAERFPSVWAAVGWHPNYVEGAPEDVRPLLAPLLRHPRVVAVGECGIDHYRLPSAQGDGTADEDERIKARQAAVFHQQLELAADAGLPVVVHQRHAFTPAMEVFAPFASRVRAVFHCFVGTPAEMHAIVGLGSCVSFTGIATFKNAADIRRTLAATPAGSFFLETDAPYLAPVPHRGKRAEPAHVADLARVVAEATGRPIEEVSRETETAVDAFFPRIRAQG